MNQRREQAIIEVEKLGKIVFRALNTKKQQPVKVGPLTDMTGRLYTGQGATGYYETLTQKEKNELPIVFDHQTVYVVMDGNVLDIENDIMHAAMWKWIKRHPYIAMSREECMVEPDAVYFVDNPKMKADNFVSRDKKVTKVKTEVYNATADKKVVVAKALGLFGAEGISAGEVEEWLILKCEELPEAVANLLNPKNASLANAMVLVKELVTYGIVRRFNSIFKYGGTDGITLGSTEEAVAEWVSDKNNEATVMAMRLEIDERKGL